jgi:hypothetical protein
VKCLSCDVIPLGLFRENENDKMRYVWTNPPMDVVILPSDIVFLILGSNQIVQSYEDPWGKYGI